jgi:hypothetical protein
MPAINWNEKYRNAPARQKNDSGAVRTESLGANPHYFVRNKEVVGEFIRKDSIEVDRITGVDRWGNVSRMKIVTRSFERYNPAKRERENKSIEKYNASLVPKIEVRRKSETTVVISGGVKYTLIKAARYTF